MNKLDTEIQFDSAWQGHTVEIMKTLYGFDDPVVNKNMGTIDYTVDDKKKKMLRVLMEGENQIRFMQMARQTIEETKNSEIDETIIVANRLTEGARKLVKDEDALSYITPLVIHPFSIAELEFVLDERLTEVCGHVCGPKGDSDSCSGVIGDTHKCPVKRIVKNAVFHSRMNWSELLHEDLNHLISYQNSNEIEVVN